MSFGDDTLHSDTPLTEEVARLRAEVDRLRPIVLPDEVAALIRERDEARAQVAVLVSTARDVLEASALGVLDQTSAISRLSDVLADVSAEARALLDRLQRAEAVR